MRTSAPRKARVCAEVTRDLVERLVEAIHEHAEAEHAADPASARPTIDGALTVAALTQIVAEIILDVPPGRQRDELLAYREAVFSAVLESAATGQSVGVSFVPLGSAH